MMKTRRVFLKLSGEALAGSGHTGFDEATVREILEAHGLWERGLKLRTPREMRQAIGDEAYQMVASYAVRSPGRDVLRRDDTVVGGPAQ